MDEGWGQENVLWVGELDIQRPRRQDHVAEIESVKDALSDDKVINFYLTIVIEWDKSQDSRHKSSNCRTTIFFLLSALFCGKAEISSLKFVPAAHHYIPYNIYIENEASFEITKF